jgi:hypothetical protein
MKTVTHIRNLYCAVGAPPLDAPYLLLRHASAGCPTHGGLIVTALPKNRAPSECSLLAWVVTPEGSRRRNDQPALLSHHHKPTSHRPRRTYPS